MKIIKMIEPEFNLGEIVYIKTDSDQKPRMIIGIMWRGNNSITYCLGYGANESWHFSIELSRELDIIKMIKG